MSNYLGIDWGERRWGLSFGDELAVATPLPALIEKEESQRWTALADVVLKRKMQNTKTSLSLKTFALEKRLSQL